MKRIIFLVVVTYLSLNTLSATTWYVNSKCRGDGTSWAQAAPDIMTLIQCTQLPNHRISSVISQDSTLKKYASPGDSIFVASGVYTPLLLWNRHNTCSNHIHIFGGFEGWEKELCERKDWRKNESVITGKNICNTVWIEGSSIITLDGFTITEGLGEGAGLRLVNCVPKLSNLIVHNNNAQKAKGGGIFFESCKMHEDCFGRPICTTLVNVLVKENSASLGGAFYAYNSTIKFINTTITYNHTEDKGSYIDLNHNCNIDFYNSILWNNINPTISYYQSPNLVNFSYCDVEDLKSIGNDIINNTDRNPMFINPPIDCHVHPQSPAIGSGNLGIYQILFKQFCTYCFLWFDLNARSRFCNNSIDMGCYQSPTCYTPTTASPQQSLTNDIVIEFYSPCGIKLSTCSEEDINQTKTTLDNGFYILVERNSVGEILKINKLIINK